MIRALVDSDAVESASALPRVRAIVQRARGISVAGATRCPKGRGPFLRTAALLDSRAQTPLIRPILGTLSLPETPSPWAVSYTHLRAHETRHDLVCRLLLEKK